MGHTVDFDRHSGPLLERKSLLVAVGTCVSSHAPRPDPYVRLSRIRLLPRVGNGTSRRIRSSACDTRAWLWVQCVLCWCAFPLAPALRSTGSAALAPVDASAVGSFALFAGFIATMARSDFSRPCIIGFGSSPSRCGPPYSHRTRRRRPDTRPPSFRYDPFARDVALDPGRATAPRIAVPHMLPSSERKPSAPAMSDLSGLNPTPHAIAVYASSPLSPVATQHSLPSGRYSLLGPDFHRLDRTSLRLAHSLNHLVGEREELVGNFQVERLRGLEIDHKLELGRLPHRQIGGFGAFQDFAG